MIRFLGQLPRRPVPAAAWGALDATADGGAL
jgi:hypothetical protein